LVILPIGGRVRIVLTGWGFHGNGWVHTSPGGGWEYPVFLIAASISLWLLGDGAAALKRSPRWVPQLRTA
jgi:putative oxidoreductase